MSRLTRRAGPAITAGLIALSGCGATAAGSPAQRNRPRRRPVPGITVLVACLAAAAACTGAPPPARHAAIPAPGAARSRGPQGDHHSWERPDPVGSLRSPRSCDGEVTGYQPQSASAGPHRDVGGLHGLVNDTGQVISHRAQVDRV
jgi:hypothetical protein